MNSFGHSADKKRRLLIQNAWWARRMARSAITPTVQGTAAGYYALYRLELRKMKENARVIEGVKENR